MCVNLAPLLASFYVHDAYIILAPLLVFYYVLFGLIGVGVAGGGGGGETEIIYTHNGRGQQVCPLVVLYLAVG